MAGFVFNRGALSLQNGAINWQTADVRVRLSRTSEILDRDSAVMTGLGLPATDRAVTGRIGPVEDVLADRILYTSDPFAFPAVALGPEVDKAIVFAFGTNDADSVPIAVVTMTNPVTPNGGGILIDIDPLGMFYTQQ